MDPPPMVKSQLNLQPRPCWTPDFRVTKPAVLGPHLLDAGAHTGVAIEDGPGGRLVVPAAAYRLDKLRDIKQF